MKHCLRLGLLLFTAVSTLHCAKTSNGTDSTTATTATTTTCTSGYLYSTTYGCQLQCGTSSVWYNGQCIAVTTTTTTTTTCSSGYLYSTSYGCQPQCGTNMIWYNNSCQVATTTTTTSVGNVCQQSCPLGYVSVGTSCLPQYTCGACYGYSGGYCFIGNGAHLFYGY